MKAQQKKTSGCASNLLAHEDLGQFEEAHCRNIQARSYNEKLPLGYESDNIPVSVSEEHGATLKHKCGKKIVTLPPFLFSFFGPFLFLFSLSLCLFGLSFFYLAFPFFGGTML